MPKRWSESKTALFDQAMEQLDIACKERDEAVARATKVEARIEECEKEIERLIEVISRCSMFLQVGTIGAVRQILKKALNK